MQASRGWLLPVLALCSFAVASSAQASDADAPSGHEEEVHWGYAGDAGPAAWGGLSAEHKACADGRTQSPVDLPGVMLDDSPPGTPGLNPADLEAHPERHPDDAVNNGHTVQVSFAGGSGLVVGSERFELLQLHFHAPSEHTVAGREFPMEAHLVHRSNAGVLAVVGVLIAEGRPNAAYAPIWEQLPAEAGAHASLASLTLDVDALLPKRRSALRYTGSLTTPPCSEGVRWLVLAEPVELSAEQIAAFTALYDHNSRLTQPLYGRSVVLEELR
jgi:carbonic anhydrase